MKIRHNEFSTDLPNGWDDRTMITLVAPFKPGDFAANIVVTKHFVEAKTSVEDFALEQQELMRQSIPSFELLDYRSTTINGLPACQQLHRFHSSNEFCQQVQNFILANQTIYSITGTAQVEEFNKYLEAFRQTVENLEISEITN